MYSSLNANSRPTALESELRSVNLEPGVKSWLIQNIDPFHDNQFVVSAPPTPSMVDSVVQCRRVRASINADSSGVIRIFVPPMARNIELYRATGYEGVTASAQYGGVMVAHGNNPYDPLIELDTIEDGPYRIVGFGWELINTTPSMYKSGSLLVYQCPQQPAQTGVVSNAVWTTDMVTVTPVSPTSQTAAYGAVAATLLPIPLSAEEAVTLPSSKQWDSKHGVYCVPRLTGFEQPFNYEGLWGSDYGSVITANGSNYVSPTSGDMRAGWPVVLPYRGEELFTGSPVPTGHPAPFVGAGNIFPYTATGCHITGLAPQSTFTFVATYYVQILPMSKSPLLSLIQPSPAYDPRAYQIYTAVMRKLPIGTYKDDNDWGTFFRAALGLIRRFAPAVGAAFGPAGALIGRGAGRVAELIIDRSNRNQARRSTRIKPR